MLYYYSIGVNSNGPTFIMNGKINVQDNGSSNNAVDTDNFVVKSNNNNSNPDAVGVYMIPYILLDKYLNQFKAEGLNVDSYYTYHDLSGGQKGTGPEQTIIV